MTEPVSDSMTTTNPKIDGKTTSVATLLGKIRTSKPSKLTIKGKKEIPPWSSSLAWDSIAWHLQGLAPYNGFNGDTLGNGCFAGSSNVAYFGTFSQESGDDPKVREIVEPVKDFVHAAGIQLLGDYLPVPLEKDDKTLAQVACYDVSRMSDCVPLHTLTMPGQKASAIGITNFTDASGVEQAILAVYPYDYTMYFYQAPVEKLGDSKSPWVLKGTYTGNALKGDQYQCFSMVTQANPEGDQVYLAGFREDEELHLFSVDVATMDLGWVNDWFQEVQVYKGWDDADWRVGGVGLQIANPTLLRVFATEKDPHGKSTSDYAIDMKIWQP